MTSRAFRVHFPKPTGPYLFFQTIFLISKFDTSCRPFGSLIYIYLSYVCNFMSEFWKINILSLYFVCLCVSKIYFSNTVVRWYGLKYLKQEYIPVGCVPSTAVVVGGGVSAQGGVVYPGIRVCPGGGVSAWRGCLPRGMSAQEWGGGFLPRGGGVCPSAC